MSDNTEALAKARGYILDAIAEAKCECQEHELFPSLHAKYSARLNGVEADLAAFDAALSVEKQEPLAFRWRWRLGGPWAFSDLAPAYRVEEREIEPLYAAPLSLETVKAEATTAARFARLHGICERIRWSALGVPAMDDPQTADAMGDLAEYLFSAGVDKAMASAGIPSEKEPKS